MQDMYVNDDFRCTLGIYIPLIDNDYIYETSLEEDRGQPEFQLNLNDRQMINEIQELHLQHQIENHSLGSWSDSDEEDHIAVKAKNQTIFKTITREKEPSTGQGNESFNTNVGGDDSLVIMFQGSTGKKSKYRFNKYQITKEDE